MEISIRSFILGLFLIVCNNIKSQAPSLQWSRQLAGDNWKTPMSIIVDSLGNVYTTGGFYGSVDFDPGPSTYSLTAVGAGDVYIMKQNPSGNLLWAKQIGGFSYDLGYSLAFDSKDNLLITGYSDYPSDLDPGPGTYSLAANGGSDVFICKLSSLGNFIWARSFGGNWNDIGFSITSDDYGNVYTTGHFSDTVDFDPGLGTFTLSSAGNYDIFICKLDSSGNFVWAKSIKEPTSYDIGQSIYVDPLGYVYTTGYFQGTADFDPGLGVFNLTSNGFHDTYINKLSPSGNFIWAKSFGNSSSDQSKKIVGDKNMNIYICGTFSSTVDFDPNSGVNNLTSYGINDWYISKFDSSGNLSWTKQFGGAGTDLVSSMTIDKFGNIYATGHFGGTSDFDSGLGVFNLTSVGTTDMFINKINSLGNHVWTAQLTSTNISAGQIAVAENGGICITGNFKQTSDFDPGVGIFNMTASTTYQDIYVLSLNDGVGISEKGILSSSKIFPNPNNGHFNLTLDFEVENGYFVLYNLLGQNIYQQKITKEENKINTIFLAKGLYQYSVEQNKRKVSCGKLVIE